MTITLTPELEAAIGEAARERGLTAEEVVLETLRGKFLPAPAVLGDGDHLSEWEQQISAAALQVEAVTAEVRKVKEKTEKP